MRRAFDTFARTVEAAAGSPWAFMLALLLVALWAVAGPFAGFSEVWQLTINTSTTIVTLLMQFVLQHTQNRNDKALHTKLDELIHAVEGARDELAGIEQEEE